MKWKIANKKTRLFVYWIVWSTILIPVSSFLAFLFNVLILGDLDLFNLSQTSPYLKSIIEYCIWGSVMGAFIGFKQWILLRKQIGITILWIFTCIGGLLIGESLAGIVLWEMGINRVELGWFQGGSILVEALIFLFSGTLIGLFQYPLVKRYYNKAGLWILACAVGWGLVPITIPYLGLMLGAITGATLVWLMKLKEVE